MGKGHGRADTNITCKSKIKASIKAFRLKRNLLPKLSHRHLSFLSPLRCFHLHMIPLIQLYHSSSLSPFSSHLNDLCVLFHLTFCSPFGFFLCATLFQHSISRLHSVTRKREERLLLNPKNLLFLREN